MEKKLEYTKFEERLDFAMDLLRRKFKASDNDPNFMNNACDIAKCLFVRSEIQYSGRRE